MHGHTDDVAVVAAAYVAYGSLGTAQAKSPAKGKATKATTKAIGERFKGTRSALSLL